MDELMETFRKPSSSFGAHTDRNSAGSTPQLAQLAEASERSLHPVALLSPDGTLLRANPPALARLTEDWQTLRGVSFWKAPWWSTSVDLSDRIRIAVNACAQGEHVYADLPVDNTNGARRVVDFGIRPVRDEAGGISVLVAEWTDVSELEATKRALYEASRKLDIASAARYGILATMSHEIRTPINAILGYTELLEIELAGPVTDQQRAFIGRIKMSTRHLLGIVEEILDVAKVESGSMVVERKSMLTLDAVDSAIGLVAPQAAAHGIVLTQRYELAADVCYVGDETRVRQILVNLLSNALKASQPGQEVVVSWGRNSVGSEKDVRDRAWIKVSDNGTGVAPDRLEDIFQPFVQIDNSYTRSNGGTGLGLTLSRRLARLMGGDLTVVSEPGRGSAFTVLLPAWEEQSISAAAGGVPDALPAHVRIEAARGGDLDEGMYIVANHLKAHVTAIAAKYASALRRDPLCQKREHASWELEDHAAPLLGTFAQTLVLIAASRGHLSLRDSSEIQHTISERHGEQRARLEWSAAAMRRETILLWEALEEEVSRAPASRSAIDRTLEILRGLVAQSARVAKACYRLNTSGA
jgi:signal transduction histidine kinase